MTASHSCLCPRNLVGNSATPSLQNTTLMPLLKATLLVHNIQVDGNKPRVKNNERECFPCSTGLEMEMGHCSLLVWWENSLLAPPLAISSGPWSCILGSSFVLVLLPDQFSVLSFQYPEQQSLSFEWIV